MFTWIIDKIRNVILFIKDTIVNTTKVVVQYVKETIVNSPAVAIMTFASFGLANTLTQLGIQSYFVPIGFINEVMIVSVISVTIIMILATIAGNIAGEDL